MVVPANQWRKQSLGILTNIPFPTIVGELGDLALTAFLVHSRKPPRRSLCLPSLMGRPKSQLTNEKFQGYDGTLNDARGAERLRVDFGDNP